MLGSNVSSSYAPPDESTPIVVRNPLNTPKPPRKRPKTQGDMRLDVQELHIEVLRLEKEKAEIEKKNLLLQQRKLELQVQLLERRVNSDHSPFQSPFSPTYPKY